jgi:hypothetical protein
MWFFFLSWVIECNRNELTRRKKGQTMKTNHLLIVMGLLATLLLASCSTKDAPSPAASQGAQAGQLTRLKAKKS